MNPLLYPKQIIQRFNPIRRNDNWNLQTELLLYPVDNLRTEWNFYMNKTYSNDVRHYYTPLDPYRNGEQFPGEMGVYHL